MSDKTNPSAPGSVLEAERCLAALDESIARGIADADGGRVHDLEDVRRELRETFGSSGAKRKGP